MPKRMSSPGARYKALLHVLKTAEALWNASREYFSRWDLSPSQFNVLNLLLDLPDGCSQVELSRQLIMHRSNVTGLVDRLEARGLVKRGSHAEDRRTHLVRLTPAGKRLIDSILPHYFRVAEEIWGDMSSSRAERIADELSRLSDNAGRIAERQP